MSILLIQYLNSSIQFLTEDTTKFVFFFCCRQKTNRYE